MFMRIFIVISVLFILCHSIESFQIQPRILNGTDSERGQFPFFVLYYAYRRYTPKDGYPCGGTLLNEKYVLTAAHCLENVTKVAVHLGSLRQFRHEKGRHVFYARRTHFHIHPEYDNDNLFNDIALIELPRLAVYSHLIQPVRFPNACEIPAEMDLIAIGNGYTATDGELSKILKYTTMTTVSHEECDENFDILSDHSTFCARSDNSSICQGDSGGPIVDAIDHSLYGLTSFTNEQDCEKMPQGFTNVIHYFPWISGITGINFNSCD